MKTYIYILQDPITQEVRYVGKSNNPKRRYTSHLCDKPKIKYYSYYWIQSLLKKGLKPIMTIIDETDSDWQQLEKYWIGQFKAWGFKLTNITEGGEGCYGAGKWNNVPVTAFTKEGILIKSFDSQKECAIYFNTSSGNVKQVCNGRSKLLLKQYQLKVGIFTENISPFKYKRNYNWVNKPETYPQQKIIICVEDNLEFNSITEASVYYNTGISSIHNNLKKLSKKLRNGKSFKYK